MSRPRRSWLVLATGLLAVAASAAVPPTGHAYQPRPVSFRLPFAAPPGPDTWLLTQAYGNTIFAYRYRHNVYVDGQGMHFGVDFGAPCGTPVVAIAAGVVTEVDNAYHGAGPHNLMIDHDNGYASFYGHLLARPALRLGEEVAAGQEIALSGDPDLTCTARPHLHLEIRDAPYHRRAYNPMLLIEADWDQILLAGTSGFGFAQDLADPQRWQVPQDQPEIWFGFPLLNDYAEVWPPDW